MSAPFRLRIDEDCVLEIEECEPLIDICDVNDTPVPFSCRAGSCGTCMVEVVQGAENLSPMSDAEEILLPELTSNPRARLGCQLTIMGTAWLRCLSE